MSSSLIDQYKTPLHQASGKLALSSPTHARKGLATYTEADPVIAKTIKIMISWKLESIPHFFLSLFIAALSRAKDITYIRGIKGPSRCLYLR